LEKKLKIDIKIDHKNMKETAKNNIKIKKKLKRKDLKLKQGLAFDNFGYVSNTNFELYNIKNRKLEKQISTISSISLISKEETTDNNFFNKLYNNIDCLEIDIDDSELVEFRNNNNEIILNKNDSIYENLSVDSDEEINLNV
jgi:hypothetical protein